MAALKRRWASPEGAPEDAIADAWAIDGAPVDGGGDLPVVRLEPKCLVKAKPKPKWFGREAEVLDVIDNQRAERKRARTGWVVGGRGASGRRSPPRGGTRSVRPSATPDTDRTQLPSTSKGSIPAHEDGGPARWGGGV